MYKPLDYSISWGYIVNKMEERFGLKPDSNKKFGFGEIEEMVDEIWEDYFYKIKIRIYDHEIE